MFKYGYVTHTNQRGMYKLDLANMRYTRSADLAPYNCVPAHIQFPALCEYISLLFYLYIPVLPTYPIIPRFSYIPVSAYV